MEKVKVMQLDKYEFGILITTLNEFRNQLIKEQKDTTYVDEIMLKAIKAPCRRLLLSRALPER